MCRGQGVRSDRTGGGPSCRGCHSALPPPHRRWTQVVYLKIWPHRCDVKAAPPPGSGATELAECGWRLRARHRPSQVRATSGEIRWSHCGTLARALSEFCCGPRVSDIWELSTMPQPELKSNEDKIWASANKNTTCCAILNNRYNQITLAPLSAPSLERQLSKLFSSKWICCGYVP